MKIAKNLDEFTFKSINATIEAMNSEEGQQLLDELRLKSLEKIDKFAIIMGNEGNGVSDEINKLSDEYIYINMNENCESLNVAIATSIILYELDK